MEIVSLLLLQPDDQIREQCRSMDPQTLARFTQTNKRIRNLCGDILAARKAIYEKEKADIMDFFSKLDTKNVIIFFENINNYNYFQIFVNNFRQVEIISWPKIAAFSDLMSGVPEIIIGDGTTGYYRFPKRWMSDQLKLDIVKIAKKLGYNTVRDANGSIYKSLNEFSII